jgi:flagellar biosynthesis GTPase FlhF
MTVDSNSATSGQEPTARLRTTSAQGASYRSQADDAGADERSGTDGGRGSPSPTTTDDNSHEDALTDDPAALRAALKAARKEAAQSRNAKQELADLKQQLENAKLSETEQLQKQLAEAQQARDTITHQAQEKVMRAEVRAEARELGMKPELALRLIDLAAVTFNDEGDPTNILELLQQARKEFGLDAPSAPAQPSSPPAGQPGVVARVAPPVPATGATNPPRGATPASQGLVRSVHDIQWRRG